MQFHENPPENERTRADRLSEAPTLLWIVLGLIVVLAFVVLLVLVHPHHHPA